MNFFSHVKDSISLACSYLCATAKYPLFNPPSLEASTVVTPVNSHVCGSKMSISCLLTPMDQFHLPSLIIFKLLALNDLLSKIC